MLITSLIGPPFLDPNIFTRNVSHFPNDSIDDPNVSIALNTTHVNVHHKNCDDNHLPETLLSEVKSRLAKKVRIRRTLRLNKAT